MSKKHFLIVFSFIIIISSGNFNFKSNTVLIVSSSIIPDYWPTEGWRFSTPEEQGMSSVKIQEMYTSMEIFDWWPIQLAAFYSFLVIRNGYVVHHYTRNSWEENTSRNIYSCTKSITSALIGIAIEEGLINSTSDRILDYFPNRSILNLTPWKEAITIEDLLTMRGGFSWDETDYSNPENDYTQMYASGDPAQYVLDKPMVSMPGTNFVYNTGCSHLLSTILNLTTGGTRDFAQDRLFDPLGIEANSWTLDPYQVPYGGSNLMLTGFEMAKFGYLYLNNGTWDGQQIIPSEWVINSSRIAESLSTDTGYGYQWWISPLDNYYSARGYKGQLIYVIPEYNMIVVFKSEGILGSIDFLVENFFIPAVGYIPSSTTTSTFTTSPTTSSTSSSTTQTTHFPNLPFILLVICPFVLRKRKKF